MEDLSTAIRSHQPLVVGAAGDHRALEGALSHADCDIIELRLDAFESVEPVLGFAQNQGTSHPLLLTARHPDEGGLRGYSSSRRAELLEKFMPFGTLMDLELRSLPDLEGLWQEAGQRNLLRVASWHNFSSCPSPTELQETIAAMAEAGADVAKCAFSLENPDDLQCLAEAFAGSPLPLSLMGMGPLGPSSRLLAASLGSVLNYGFLGEHPTAPGQWPARLLKEALRYSGIG